MFAFRKIDNLKPKVPKLHDNPSTKCEKGFFQCEIDLYCISKRFVCDGINDCWDKTDEKDCKNLVMEKFECDSRSKRIPYFLLCDGIHDCSDKSDEEYCRN